MMVLELLNVVISFSVSGMFCRCGVVLMTNRSSTTCTQPRLDRAVGSKGLVDGRSGGGSRGPWGQGWRGSG